jgi:tight adherence protein C
MTPQLAFTLLILFTAVAVATGVVSWQVLENRNPVRRRLRQLVQPQPVTVRSNMRVLLDEPTKAARRLARLVPASPARIRKMTPRLAAVGYRGQSAVVFFSAMQVVAAAVVGVAAFAILGLAWWRVAVVLSVGAFLMPDLWVRRKYKRRQRDIRNALPDALDLCVICLEAGCSLDVAIVKASDQLAITYPALAAELNLVRAEIRAGKTRAEAFKNFAARTQVDEVRSLVATLIQTERFGTSIAQALRVHASAARSRRRMKAEERAAKSSVKLVFPLVLFLFPAFYVITLGPAILEIVRGLAQMR